jgi:hypothetical protein
MIKLLRILAPALLYVIEPTTLGLHNLWYKRLPFASLDGHPVTDPWGVAMLAELAIALMIYGIIGFYGPNGVRLFRRSGPLLLGIMFIVMVICLWRSGWLISTRALMMQTPDFEAIASKHGF